MIQDTEKTNVQFHVATYEALELDEQSTKEVIAVFKDYASMNDGKICFDCYTSSEQHSICSQSFLAENCRKATKEEYQELFNELTNSVGYNLNVL